VIKDDIGRRSLCAVRYFLRRVLRDSLSSVGSHQRSLPMPKHLVIVLLNDQLLLTHPMIVHNDPGRRTDVLESDSKSLNDSKATKFESATFEPFSSDGNRVSTLVLMPAISAFENALKKRRKRRASRLTFPLCFPQLPTSGVRWHVGGLWSVAVGLLSQYSARFYQHREIFKNAVPKMGRILVDTSF
jgi:hypothetical protein